MVWFLGSEFKKRKLVGKYYFEKNNHTSLKTNALGARRVYNAPLAKALN